MIYAAEPYPGVTLIACDFRMPGFALPHMEHYPYLKMNYCTGGRCEVPLDNRRYAYLESGVLELDLNQSQGELALPTGAYQGLELIVNLEQLAADYPAAWQECGVQLLEAPARLQSRSGSIHLRAAPQWDAAARDLMARLQACAADLGELRFGVLQLLHLLRLGEGMEEITVTCFLTKGQRAVVAKAERLLTADLRQRLSIEQAAEEAGVSPSALKKYFGQVYGKSISAYLREKRIAQACALLAGSSASVAEIALAVGYQNQGKFGAVFARVTGATPTEYRRLCRTGEIEKGVDHT